MLALADFEVVRDDAHVVCPSHVPLLSELLNRYRGPPARRRAALADVRHHRPARRRTAAAARAAAPERERRDPVPQRGRPHPAPGRAPAPPRPEQRVPVRGGQLDGRHGGRDPRGRSRSIPACRCGSSSRRARARATPCASASREARGEVLLILDSDMGVAPGRRAEVRGGARARQGRAGQRLAPRLPHGGAGHALPEPARQQVLRAALLLAARPAGARHPVRHQGPLPRRTTSAIAANRAYFGDFDPFGDFDLLFGAARLNLRIVDLAVRYHERRYGETNISRFTPRLAARCA